MIDHTFNSIKEWFERIWFCHHNARVLVDMEDRFSRVLSEATGGQMSKTNYTWPAMKQCIDEHYSEIIKDALKDIEQNTDSITVSTNKLESAVDGWKRLVSDDLDLIERQVKVTGQYDRQETLSKQKMDGLTTVELSLIHITDAVRRIRKTLLSAPSPAVPSDTGGEGPIPSEIDEQRCVFGLPDCGPVVGHDDSGEPWCQRCMDSEDAAPITLMEATDMAPEALVEHVNRKLAALVRRAAAPATFTPSAGSASEPVDWEWRATKGAGRWRAALNKDSAKANADLWGGEFRALCAAPPASVDAVAVVTADETAAAEQRADDLSRDFKRIVAANDRMRLDKARLIAQFNITRDRYEAAEKRADKLALESAAHIGENKRLQAQLNAARDAAETVSRVTPPASVDAVVVVTGLREELLKLAHQTKLSERAEGKLYAYDLILAALRAAQQGTKEVRS